MADRTKCGRASSRTSTPASSVGELDVGALEAIVGGYIVTMDLQDWSKASRRPAGPSPTIVGGFKSVSGMDSETE